MSDEERDPSAAHPTDEQILGRLLAEHFDLFGPGSMKREVYLKCATCTDLEAGAMVREIAHGLHARGVRDAAPSEPAIVDEVARIAVAEVRRWQENHGVNARERDAGMPELQGAVLDEALLLLLLRINERFEKFVGHPLVTMPLPALFSEAPPEQNDLTDSIQWALAKQLSDWKMPDEPVSETLENNAFNALVGLMRRLLNALVKSLFPADETKAQAVAQQIREALHAKTIQLDPDLDSIQKFDPKKTLDNEENG